MIELEHTIFILLLLSGILNAKLPRPRWAILIILIGVLLAFISPAQVINVPWNLVIGLVIPLILWQNIRRIANADWRGWKSVALWGISGLIFSFVLGFGGALNWPGAFLFGVIAASMIWRAGEPESRTSYISQVGTSHLDFPANRGRSSHPGPKSLPGRRIQRCVLWGGCGWGWFLPAKENVSQAAFLPRYRAGLSCLLVFISRRGLGGGRSSG